MRTVGPWRWVVFALVLVGAAGTVILLRREQATQPRGIAPRDATDPGVSTARPAQESERSVAVLEPEGDPQAPVVQEQPAPGHPQAIEPESAPDSLSVQYGHLSVAALKGELAGLELQVPELSKGPLKERFDLGLHDEVGVGPELLMDRIWDPTLVMNVVGNDTGWTKVVLPRAEFPEIYRLHDQKLWLAAEIERRED